VPFQAGSKTFDHETGRPKAPQLDDRRGPELDQRLHESDAWRYIGHVGTGLSEALVEPFGLPVLLGSTSSAAGGPALGCYFFGAAGPVAFDPVVVAGEVLWFDAVVLCRPE
jgi:hypothetical protein